MTAPDALEAPDAFLDKFRARWPEWSVGLAFVPAAGRGTVEAWLALLQEFADAAWGGAEDAPGLAKLAWWQDELRGWGQGARRHPLGRILRTQAVDWAAVAGALDALPASRDPDPAAALAALAPLSAALSKADAALAAEGGPWRGDDELLGRVLLGERALRRGGREEAGRVLELWREASGRGTRPRRIHAALLRRRLQAIAAGRPPAPPPAWRVLPLVWRAARGPAPRAR